MSRTADRFRTAAWAYFAYGVVYWVGGVYLLAHGIGVEGGATGARSVVSQAFWALLGLALVLLIPYLLRAPRPWFERWILTRRDFARILALLLAVRAVKVGEIAARPEAGAVPAPWGGVITFQAGALVFLVVTLVTLALVVRAAWARER